MAKRRWLAPWRDDGKRPTIYHLINRVVDRRFVLGDPEREKFRMFMRMAENFTGCRVLSYCVMSNHFHVLLEVPPRVSAVGDCRLPFVPDGEDVLATRVGAAGGALASEEPGEALDSGIAIDEEEFFERLRTLYSVPVVDAIRGEVADAKTRNNQDEVARIFARYAYRMHDLSEFMKTLTQRFSSWFNRANERKGRLWEQRFKSVIVEDGLAAKTMAAYIDLNPVRAGMVEDPADYRWSSYGEAVAGGRKARAGLARVARVAGGQIGSHASGKFDLKVLLRSWGQGGVGKAYRKILIGSGTEKALEARIVRKGMAPDKAEKELEALESRRSDLAISSAIRKRVRYFSDGAVLGGKDFVEEVFSRNRDRFGKKRKTGARKLRGASKVFGKELWVARDLKKE